MGSEFDYTLEERQVDVNAGLYQKFYIVTPVEDIEFTIGAEDSEVIEVQCQVVDPAGDAMEDVYSLQLFITSDEAGLIPAVFTSVTMAATTGTVQVITTADEDLQFATDDTGLIVFDLTDSATSAETRYMAIRLPGGQLAVSGAITFAT
jgi:hypothetical protein